MKIKTIRIDWKKWGIAIAIISVLGNAIAPIKSRAEQDLNCENPMTTAEITNCILQQYEESDRRLNEVYQQLMSVLSYDERERLIDKQLEWIAYRDETCEEEVGRVRGGTAYSSYLTACLDRVTRQRTAELEEYLSDRF